MERIAILAIGSASEGSVRRAQLPSQRVDLQCVRTLGEAHEALQCGFAPALIVVSERWPGEIQHGDLSRLQQYVPLTRIWRIAGPWCEGEMRTAPPKTGSLRTYWHQTDVRLADELSRWARGKPARALLPVTTTDEEAALALAEQCCEESSFIVVHASEREAGLALIDACEACGYRAIWIKDVGGAGAIHARAVLCDIRVDELSNPALVHRMQAMFGRIPIIAVMGFPRPHDVSTAQAKAFAALVSKPLELSDLAWHLRRCGKGIC